MARMARVVIPNHPHHIIQRGNRSQKVFFGDEDKRSYIDFLCKYAKEAGVSFWAYCLMDNHIHLIAVPASEESFAKGLGDAHKNYTRMINFRHGWRGYLWQGRFMSNPLDERHFYAAVRYVECNPVRAGLVAKAEDYPFSSARAHVLNKKDTLLADNFMLSEISDWSSYLAEGDKDADRELFRRHASTGRPLGDKEFVLALERMTGRILKKKKPGPKA